DSVVAGLGISSPNSQHPHQFAHGHSSSMNSPSTTPRLQQQQNHHQGLTVNTKPMSPRHDRSTFAVESPMLTSTTTSITTAATTTTTAEFNPEEFRMEVMRQISDKLESGLSQIVSASLPLSPATSDKEDEPEKGKTSSAAGDDDGASTCSATTGASSSTTAQLKRALRITHVEIERLKLKNQELLEEKHSLELQRVDLQHTVARLQDQVVRLQDLEMNNQFLLSRVKDLESSRASSSLDSLETRSATNGHTSHPQHHNYASSQNGSSQEQLIQRLTQEVATLTAERDQLKIRQWQQQGAANGVMGVNEIRSAHYVDLENERNRLVDELGAKTVAMEALYNSNEELQMRARGYQKRVLELERQCAVLEEENAQVARIRADLVEMEARAVAADALVEKLQDMEGQVTLIKNLQDRINELETTNAELDHNNWRLTEELNVASNQHLLLTKEFENFRSRDKDDRQLQILQTRIRELEQQLQEKTATQPDYKEEYERVSTELEKLRLRQPQLEGQAKQVSLMRSKILALEKQIKTMEEMEPRLAEMQQLNERNLFLENELGELEMLRARELELETQIDELKARLAQLDQNKISLSRMNSFRQQQQHGRARSGSMAPLPLSLQLHQQQHVTEEEMMTGSPLASPSLQRTAQKSADYRQMSFESGLVATSPKSPMASGNGMSTVSTASAWPSGRSSMSMTTNRMSTSSSTSSHHSTSSFSMSSVSVTTATNTQQSQSQQASKDLEVDQSTTLTTTTTTTTAASSVVSTSSSTSLASSPATETMDEPEHHENKENQAPAMVMEQAIVA
ncbi:hypothetical protein BGW42_002228, partial [Actinomortierella wolfii]